MVVERKMANSDQANKLCSWDKIVEAEIKLKKDAEGMRQNITVAYAVVITLAFFFSTALIHSAPFILYASTLGEAQTQTIFEQVELIEEIPTPTIHVGTGSQGYDQITIEGMENGGEPGEPLLPIKTVRVLVPYGTEVHDIKVTGKKKIRIKGNYTIEPAQEPIPLSYEGEIKPTKPDPIIYDSDLPYPDKVHEKFGTHTLTGYDILIVDLNPVEYIPKKGEISYYQTLEVTVSFKPIKDKKDKNRRNLAEDVILALSIVDNPDTMETYPQTASFDGSYYTSDLVDPSESYTYVIITNASLKDSFQPLIDWKKTRLKNPITATTVLVEDIVGNPAYWCSGTWGDGCGTGNQFNDTAAKIRNFIKDAYNNWETEYILLGGDDEIIPVRYLFDFLVYGYPELYSYIPGDTYYASLDGNWDNDGDGVWGEGPAPYETGDLEADLYAEVSIGRAPVETPTETANFVNKTISYEQAAIGGYAYLDKALMVGEVLIVDEITKEPKTFGGDSKDLAADMLDYYTIKTLYERDGTFSNTAVAAEINNDTHIINHLGHAHYTSVMGLATYHIDALTNTEYCMIYSEGCLSAGFDQAMSKDSEAVGEHFVFDDNGAFAYIGNTRFGWLGGAEKYDLSFFDALVNEGIRPIGKALKDSKEDLLSGLAARWIHYSLNLLGDPETPIYLPQKVPCADKGDYDLDGYITQKDLGGCTNVYWELEDYLDRCDVNNNGITDWGDVVAIQYYVWELIDTFPVCTTPDLVVESDDIAFSNDNPSTGSEVTITATIRNIDNGTAANFKVRLYVNNYGYAFNDTTVLTLTGGSSQQVVFRWIAVPGTYNVTVILDPENSILESREDNNNAEKTLTVDSPRPPCREYGDITGDGSVNNEDVYFCGILIGKAYAEKCDVDTNVQVDDNDILLIGQYVNGTIQTFPVCSHLREPPCDGFGDYNQDGVVSGSDIVSCEDIGGYYDPKCDVDNNSVVEAVDTTLMREYFNGSIDTFPACYRASPCGDKGDYNLDGYITQEDVDGCTNVYWELEDYIDRCEVNANGEIDWGDIVAIQYYVWELTDTFPVCKRTPPCGSYGDYDGDGYVTEEDATQLFDNIETTTDPNMDVNDNGYIDFDDVAQIHHYALWDQDTFPACKTTTTTTTLPPCYDTDGGLNYEIKGVLTSEDLGTRTDYCSTSKKLIEYYCRDGSGYSKKHTCPKGCLDGACK